MKKAFLLFAVITTTIFTSCKSDDDGTTQELDSIIGTWTISQRSVNGVEDEIDECVKQGTIIFKDDNTSVEKSYELSEGGQCVLNSSNLGNWENLGSGNYEINYSGPDEDTFTFKPVFEGNTMTVEFTDSDGDEQFEIKVILLKS